MDVRFFFYPFKGEERGGKMPDAAEEGIGSTLFFFFFFKCHPTSVSYL